MKFWYFSIFVLSASFSKGQVYEYWIFDKEKIKVTVYSEDGVSDTSAWIINDTVKLGTQIIFWDKEKKVKCTEIKKSRDEKSVVAWYKNGQIKENYLFHYGKRNPQENDLSDRWFSDGKKWVESNYIGSLKISLYYYPSGQLKEKIIGTKDRKMWGYGLRYYQTIFDAKWCENGTLICRDSGSTDIVRKKTFYYCNGKKSKEYTSAGNLNFGTYTEWYENGQIKVQGYYDPVPKGKQIPPVSREQGEWSYFWESGDLIKIIKFKNGVLVK